MLNSQVNMAMTGATQRRSRRPATPREALAAIVLRSPGKDGGELLQEFQELARSNESYLSSIIEEWFRNAYRSLTRPSRSVGASELRQKEFSRVKETVRANIKFKANVVLMDIVLPTGKKLRDSTGSDCRYAGGWLTQIAKVVGPTQLVGRVMSESDLRQFLVKQEKAQ
jgi:hypothetical protein